MTKIASTKTAPKEVQKSKTVRIVFADKQKCEEAVFIFAFEDMVEKWRKDKSIPLVDVIQSFEIFDVSNGGVTGKAAHVSKQILSNLFGTFKDSEVIPIILEKGKSQHVTTQYRNDEKSQFVGSK